MGVLPIISEDQKQLVAKTVRNACDWINDDSLFAGMKPAETLCVTILGLLLIKFFWTLLCFVYTLILRNNSLESIKKNLFKFASAYIPQVKAHIEKEKKKIKTDCHKKFIEKRSSTAIRHLPQDGWAE